MFLFNVLPAVPLDGGYMFKDALDLFIKRLRKELSDEKRERISVCTDCSRTVEKDAIYELGKTWCVDCYKSNVLKIHE